MIDAAGHIYCAWDLIGYDGDHYLRVVGGTAVYEAADYRDDTHGDHVRLMRLDATTDGLRQINRYVGPDTLIELVTAARGADGKLRATTEVT